MKPDPDRQVLIDQMTERFRKQLEAEMTDDNATLEQIEEAVDKIGKAVLPELQEKRANQRAKKPRDNQTTCSCGAKARYRGLETRHFLSGISQYSEIESTGPSAECLPADRIA